MMRLVRRALLATVPMIIASVAGAQGSNGTIDNLLIPPGAPRAPNGVLGHVEVLGRGPVPLILIPGAPFTWREWSGFAARNAERYTMYAITIPGYGGTPLPATPPDEPVEHRAWTNGVVRGLRDLVERRKLDRPVIVANHLMASYYAVRLAGEMECRIGGIIELASDPIAYDPFRIDVPRTPEERLTRLHQSWLPFYRGVDSVTWSRGTFPGWRLTSDTARARRLGAQQVGTPLHTQVRYFLEYLSDDTSPVLRALRVPMLSVVPKFDSRVLPDSVRRRLLARLGSVAAVEDSITQLAYWRRRYDVSVPGLATRFLESKTLVMMDDEPRLIDGVVDEFVGRRRGCQSGGDGRSGHTDPASNDRSSQRVGHRSPKHFPGSSRMLMMKGLTGL
jgi:pimeloyl-ACP methyl ester carboxylesterase